MFHNVSCCYKESVLCNPTHTLLWERCVSKEPVFMRCLHSRHPGLCDLLLAGVCALHSFAQEMTCSCSHTRTLRNFSQRRGACFLPRGQIVKLDCCSWGSGTRLCKSWLEEQMPEQWRDDRQTNVARLSFVFFLLCWSSRLFFYLYNWIKALARSTRCAWVVSVFRDGDR